MAQVVYDTEPLEVGEFQMRMPPMVGGGDIAIPLLFLNQVYSKSVAFGYALGGATQRRQLDASLRSFHCAALSNEAMEAGEGDGGAERMEGPEAEAELGTLAQYLYGAHGTRAEMLCVREQVPRQVRARWVTRRASWVTLRASWVTLRARWVMLRARWVTLRAR